MLRQFTKNLPLKNSKCSTLGCNSPASALVTTVFSPLGANFCSGCRTTMDRHGLILSENRSKLYIKTMQYSEEWTTEYTRYELTQQLCSIEEFITTPEGRTIPIKKYYHQAYVLQPRIFAGEPAPTFTIHLSDLTPQIKAELGSVEENTRNYILLSSIGKIFENIGPAIYFESLARKLSWKLV